MSDLRRTIDLPSVPLGGNTFSQWPSVWQKPWADSAWSPATANQVPGDLLEDWISQPLTLLVIEEQICSCFPHVEHTFQSCLRDLLVVVRELLIHTVVEILLSVSGVADVIAREWNACLFVFHSTWRDVHFKVCTRCTYGCQCWIPSGLHCLRRSRVSGKKETLTNNLNEIRQQVRLRCIWQADQLC